MQTSAITQTDSALYEQLENVRLDLAELKSRLFRAWQRNRWRHELLHLEHLFVLALLLDEQHARESVALLREPVLQIMAHFTGDPGGEVITQEAASLLCLIENVQLKSGGSLSQPFWAIDEGS
jgi:hypothetical protein